MRIVGYDGNEAFDFFYSLIYMVEHPLNEIGAKSVNVLKDLVNDLSKIIKNDLKCLLNISKSNS